MSLTLRYLMMHARQAPPGEHLPPGDPTVGVAQNVETIIAVSIFSIALATASVALRFIFRATSKLSWMLDDWALVVAMLFANADAACYLWALKYGFGQHIYVLEPQVLEEFFKIVFVTFLFYGVAVTFVKFSVLLFYNRIFPQNKFKRWLIILGILSFLWWVAIILVTVLECIPVQKIWNPTVPGKCIPYLDLFIALQVLNIVLDTAILALPIKTVLSLQMSSANKWSVGGTFALGGLSVVFAVVRLAILVTDMSQTDITYATPTASWSLVEPAFEIFCACLPCFTPVLKLGRWASKTASKRSQNSKDSYGSSKFSPQNKWNSHLSSNASHALSASREHPYDRFDDPKEMTRQSPIRELPAQRGLCRSCGRQV